MQGAAAPQTVSGVPLSEDDLRRFGEDGYLVVRGVVPEALLAAADAEIDEIVSTPPPLRHEGVGHVSWSPRRADAPRCDDVLVRSSALAIATALVAPDTLACAFPELQVATTELGWSHIPGGPHIDGHGPEHDPWSFTLLAGVLLTDQTSTAAGNLWVWPGSHLLHQELFRSRGTAVLGLAGGHIQLADPGVALGPPVPITGERGDLVLAHFLLGHNSGGNERPWVRRTLYWRLATPGHRGRWEETFVDAWAEYPAVRRALSR